MENFSQNDIERLNNVIDSLNQKIEQLQSKMSTAANKALLETYENMLKANEQLKKSLEAQSKNVDAICKKYAVTADEVKKIVDLEEKKRALIERINKVVAASGSTSNASVLTELGKEKDKLEKQLNDIQNQQTKNVQLEAKEYDKILNQNKKIQDKKKDQLETQKELNKEEKTSAELNEKIVKRTQQLLNGWRAIVATVKPGVYKWHELERLSKATARTMGMSARQSEAYMRNLGELTQNLAYNYGMTVEEIDKIQNSFVKATNRSIMLNAAQQENLVSMSKLGGSEVASEFLDIVDRFGGSSDAALQSFTAAYGNAMKLGLNAEKASSAVAKNMALMNTYNFKNGIDGITKMTMLAQKLKIDLSSAVRVVDKFENLDDAIQTTAQMQVLGGVGGMMFGNALENFSQALIDPEALIEKLTKITAGKGTFNRTTGMVDIGAFDKRMLREQAKAFGLSAEEIMTMANQNARNADILRDIRSTRGGRSLTEEQISLLQNKATFDKENNAWQVSYFDEENKLQTKKITDILSSDAESQKKMFAQMSNSVDAQSLIQGDVNKIREYAKALVDRESKNKGFIEQWNVSMAEALDPLIKGFYGVKDWFAQTVFPLVLGGGIGTWVGMTGMVGKNMLQGKIVNAIQRWVAEKSLGLGGASGVVSNNTNQSQPQRNPQRPSRPPRPSRNPQGKTNSSWRQRLGKFKQANKLGGAVGGALAIYNLYNADKQHTQDIQALSSDTIQNTIGSYTDAESGNKRIADMINAKRNAQIVNAIGAFAGGFIPGAGIIGSLVGGSLMGKDNRNVAEMVQEDYETAKFGTTNITDDNLAAKADLATIKMHDILVSIWYHMNGRQSNGAIENKGIIGNLKEGNVLGAVGSVFQTLTNWFGNDEESKAHYVPYLGAHAEGGMVDQNVAVPKEIGNIMKNKGEDGIAAVKRDELIVTKEQMNHITHNVVNNTDISSKPIGNIAAKITPQYSAPNFSPKTDFNVNINGTLKLDGSSIGGKQMDIDIESLMKTPQFKAQIAEIIKNSMTTINGKMLKDSKANKLGNVQAYGGF